jgi:hypothetical protein
MLRGVSVITCNPAERIPDFPMNIFGGQYQLFAACNCHCSERCPIMDPNLLVNVMEVNLYGTLRKTKAATNFFVRKTLRYK